MCGIAGLVNFDPSEAGIIISRMVAMQNHRGPDSKGIWCDKSIALGHNRLAIIDLDAKANQPMQSQNGRYVMVYNGEIYNFKEIKNELKHIEWQTNSDSEVLLEAYVKWGVDCLHKLNGMFAFAIWDKQKNKLFIARDRMGVKPLYFSIKNNQFLFASELRTLLKTGVLSKKINLQSVHDFIRFQWIQSPDTIIDGISCLPAGSYGVWEKGIYSETNWWNIQQFEAGENSITKADINEVHQNVKDLFNAAVERRLVSDVPIGAFLSGGIDSGLIVAAMANINSAKVNTFTIGFKEKQYDESAYADKVAKKFNTNHQTLIYSADTLKKELPEILTAFDTPSTDGINSFVISNLVKKAGITVALCGLGGDELFCGYPVFRHLPTIQKYKLFWQLPKFLRNKGNEILQNSGNTRWEKIGNILNAPSANKEALYPFFREIFSEKKTSKFIIPKFTTSKFEVHLENHRNSSVLSWLSSTEIQGYARHVLLKDTDMCSMAHALEIRVPFFDYKLVEYVLGLPDSFRQSQIPKKLLIDSFKGELPADIVNRPKMGFSFPWDIWIRNDLKFFVEDVLSKSVHYDFLNKDEINSGWKRFLNGDKSIKWYHIWNLVCLIHWMESNIEGKG